MSDHRRAWREDDRSVSTTLSYVLTLAITTVLISGLLIAGGTMVETQRERVAEQELGVTAERLATGLADADRLGDTVTGGAVRVRVWLPEQIAGSAYNIELKNETMPAAKPAKATISMSSQFVDADTSLSLRTGIPIANRTIIGGPVVIEHKDVDGDGNLELVVNESGSLAAPVTAPVGPVGLRHDEVVFVDSDTKNLSSVSPNGTVTDYGVDAQAIGPKQVDLDGDGLREIPYVDSSNRLRIVDEEGEVKTLASDAAHTPLGQDYKTLLAIGEWRGETSVFYLNTSDTVGGEASIYRVGADGDATQVTVGGNGVAATAIAGIGDMNGDGDGDLVYAFTSQEMYYLDDGGKQYTGTDVGANNGIGIGATRVFASGESPNVPYVDGSNEVQHHPDRISSPVVGGAIKTPVAAIDWAGDATLEVVYVSNDDSTLQYVYRNNGTTKTINDSQGDPITVDVGAGTA